MKRILEKLNGMPLWEIACLIGGLLFLIFGSFAVATLICIAGILLIAFAAYNILSLLRFGEHNIFFAVKILAHIFSLFVGTVLAVAPAQAISFVGLMAGLYLAVYSGWQLYKILLVRIAGFRDGLLTGINALCFLAGLFLIFFRSLIPDAISVVLGIALIFEGGSGLMCFLQKKKMQREEEIKSGVIYAEKFDDKSDSQS